MNIHLDDRLPVPALKLSDTIYLNPSLDYVGAWAALRSFYPDAPGAELRAALAPVRDELAGAVTDGTKRSPTFLPAVPLPDDRTYQQ